MYDVKKRLISFVCAFFIFFSSVFVSYQTAYAADAPAVDVGEGLTYLFQMLSSSIGSSVAKASVPSLYLAVDAYSKTSDPAYMAQLREYYKDDALVRSEPIDTGFCNWLLGAIKDVFVSSGDYGTDAPEYVVPASGGATYFDVAGSFSVDKITYNVPAGVYIMPYWYLINDDTQVSVSVYALSDNYFFCENAVRPGYGYGGTYKDFFGFGSCYWVMIGSFGDSTFIDVPYVTQRYNPVASDTVDVTIYIDKALEIIQSQALVKTPAITAPISVPADTAAMEENAKAVAAADNADALYKALAAAGIAIGVDVDVPDETDKPTDAEIPDEGTSTIGKSLSDIIAGINALGVKIASIPDSVITGIKDALTALFIPDSNFFQNEVNSLLDSLKAVLPYQDYIDALCKIKDFSSGNLEDIKVNVSGSRIVESGGTQVTIVSFSGIRDSLPTYHKWVRGLFLVLLVLFNVNQLYKLIRGVSLFAGGRDE